MALDLLQQWSEPPVVLSSFDFLDQDCPKNYLSCDNAPMTWRHGIFSIVHDCLGQIEPNHADENSHLWRQEARQRALNFARLGLSEIMTPDGEIAENISQRRDIEAIAALGGAYRILAKSNGLRPVQCKHVFFCFLTNLAKSYAPVCGEILLELLVCPILLQPVGCRSMILCTGMLIQGAMRQANYSRIARRMVVELAKVHAGGYRLSLRLPGKLRDLLGSPEFDVASRLCAVFRSELSCTEAPDNGISIRLSFPPGRYP